MKKFFRRFFRVLLVLLILSIILALASTFIFQRQIGNRIITEVNGRIASELSADDIGMDIWSNFPTTKAYLNGIQLTDTEGNTLMKAQKATLELKLTSLFGTNYIIYAVNIDSGEVFLKISPEGLANYNIFSDSTDIPPSQATNVSIDKAILTNMKLHYHNEQQRHKAEFAIDSMEIEGEFSARRFEMKNTAQLTSEFYDTDQLRFFENKQISWSTYIDVDLNARSYDLNRAQISINDHPFRLEGDIEKWEKGYFLDLFISSENSQLNGPIQLLPASYEKILGNFESEGNTNFTAVVKGLWGETQNPEMKAELKLDRGSIQHPKLEEPIDSAQFAVLFNNGDLKSFQTSTFEIRDFKGRLGGQALEGQLIIHNFENPNIDLTFDGKAPLNIFQPLLKDDQLSNLEGNVAIRRFMVKGRYENMISPGYIGLVETEGQFELSDVVFTIDGDTAKVDSGVFDLIDNKLTVNRFRLRGLGSELELEGTVFNLIPLLLADEDNSEDVELEFEASLKSKQLDLDKVLVAVNLMQDSTNRRMSSRQLVQKREKISRYLKGTTTAEIDSFNYYNFSGKNFSGNLNFANNEIQLKGTTETMEGKAELEGRLLLDYRPRLETRLDFQGINAQQLLTQGRNFNQDFLTARHISGKLDGHLILETYWDESGAFMKERMKAMAGLIFKNGYLKEIEPLSEWARYIKKPQLDSIGFDEAKAYVEIRRRKVYIPLLLISSDSARLTMSGEHRFNDNFRYHLKLNARSALAKSIQDSHKDLVPTAANQSGFYNFYHSIYGHRQKFDIRAARAQVKADLERSQIRRSEIHKTLMQAFDQVPIIEEPSGWRDEQVIKEE